MTATLPVGSDLVRKLYGITRSEDFPDHLDSLLDARCGLDTSA